MTYGEGYVIGIGLAFFLYLLVRRIDRNYYRRKINILKARKERLKAKKKLHK